MLRLLILATHISEIMTRPAPDTFSLHPCKGIDVDVQIEPAQNLPGPIWDRVTINGKACGNRHGGVQEFIKLVNTHKPTIDWDDGTRSSVDIDPLDR